MSDAGPTIHQCECDVCKGGGDAAAVRYHQQVNLFLSCLNEPRRRWYVGVISEAADSPSDRQLALVTGLDEKTIRRGRHELAANLAGAPRRETAPSGRRAATRRKNDPAMVGRCFTRFGPQGTK